MSVSGGKRLRELEPFLQPWAFWLLGLTAAQGWDVHITSVFRSAKEQERLYFDWLSGRRILPAAAPYCSQHQYRIAWDMLIEHDRNGPRQRAIGGAWREVGGLWGGLGDPVHFGARWSRPEGC